MIASPRCRGAAEHVCQCWRLLALALPASRVTLDFADSVWGADEPGFVAALLQALGSRPVGRVEIEHAPGSLPPQFWSELGEGLVARARGCAKRSLAGGAALPVVVFCMNRSTYSGHTHMPWCCRSTGWQLGAGAAHTAH